MDKNILNFRRKTIKCRYCNTNLGKSVFDLGHQPLSNDYLKKYELEQNETYLPKLFLCSSCGLLQIPAYKSSMEVFKEDYAYLSSTSKTLCNHAKSFVDYAIKYFNLNTSSFVVEIASNDGYLLEHVLKKKIFV